MSSRYATTEYNRHTRVCTRLEAVFSRARVFHFHADKLSEEIRAVWESEDARRLTQYYKGYARGLADEKRARIWQDCVEWRLGPSTGWTRRAHEDWTEEMSRLSREPGALYGGHFWIGTDIQFTTYTVINAGAPHLPPVSPEGLRRNDVDAREVDTP